jgi:peptidoglycan/LPS O-acetylase OafA/YrhL
MADQTTTQNFWQKNQVFLSGLAGALVLALQQFLDKPEIDYKVLGLAAVMAVASYVGNQWRGKGVTVAGFIAVIAGAFVTIQTTGHFTWAQFITACVVGFLAMVAPPPKNIAYEQSDTIVTAKAEGAAIVAEEKAAGKEEVPPPINYTTPKP